MESHILLNFVGVGRFVWLVEAVAVKTAVLVGSASKEVSTMSHLCVGCMSHSNSMEALELQMIIYMKVLSECTPSCTSVLLDTSHSDTFTKHWQFDQNSSYRTFPRRTQFLPTRAAEQEQLTRNSSAKVVSMPPPSPGASEDLVFCRVKSLLLSGWWWWR